jgi:hypothetical protein
LSATSSEPSTRNCRAIAPFVALATSDHQSRRERRVRVT